MSMCHAAFTVLKLPLDAAFSGDIHKTPRTTNELSCTATCTINNFGATVVSLDLCRMVTSVTCITDRQTYRKRDRRTERQTDRQAKKEAACVYTRWPARKWEVTNGESPCLQLYVISFPSGKGGWNKGRKRQLRNEAGK